MPVMTPDRYDGKPLLRLVDCYVLDAIGELDPGQRKTLDAMEPKLQALYGQRGSWQEIVRAQAQLPPAEEIRSEWRAGAAERPERDADAFVLDYVDGLGLV